jgi:molybdopterin-guanine dinucleotide biosynthesis protein A
MNSENREPSAMAGYILAGGASSRFGGDKALAVIGGRSMLKRMMDLLREVTEPVKVVAAPGKYALADAEIVEDHWPGEGPMGGIITALEDAKRVAAPAEWNLIVSCDMPFLTREWLAFLCDQARKSEAQVVLARSAHGMEPLCACWRTDTAEVLRGGFERGVRRVNEGITLLRAEVLDEVDWKRFDSAGRLFWNMNTAADYEKARQILEAEQA